MKRIVAIAASLLIFGCLYAYRITTKPIRTTWLEVVVGDAATDAGTSAALVVLTGNWYLALVPWAAHTLTGLPMIIAQALKEYFLNSTVEAIGKYEHPA